MTVQTFAEQLISNRNLLDNPWFTVNQRGFTSGQITSPYYFVDRWMFTGTAEVNVDGTITLSNTGSSDAYFVQRLPYEDAVKLVGKQLVKSYDVVAYSGTIYDYMGYYNSGNTYQLLDTVKSISSTGITKHSLTLSSFTPKSDKQFVEFTINLNPGASLTLRAVKLEIGSVSTLVLDTEPNYATELLKCQRYFYRITPIDDPYGSLLDLGFCFRDSQARAPIQTPVAMRAMPTVSYNKICFVKASETGVSMITSSQITNSHIYDNASYSHFIFAIDTSVTLTTGDLGYIRAENDVNAYIELSAEI